MVVAVAVVVAAEDIKNAAFYASMPREYVRIESWGDSFLISKSDGLAWLYVFGHTPLTLYNVCQSIYLYYRSDENICFSSNLTMFLLSTWNACSACHSNSCTHHFRICGKVLAFGKIYRTQ